MSFGSVIALIIASPIIFPQYFGMAMMVVIIILAAISYHKNPEKFLATFKEDKE